MRVGTNTALDSVWPIHVFELKALGTNEKSNIIFYKFKRFINHTEKGPKPTNG